MIDCIKNKNNNSYNKINNYEYEVTNNLRLICVINGCTRDHGCNTFDSRNQKFRNA